jgi:hypothetical protein
MQNLHRSHDYKEKKILWCISSQRTQQGHIETSIEIRVLCSIWICLGSDCMLWWADLVSFLFGNWGFTPRLYQNEPILYSSLKFDRPVSEVGSLWQRRALDRLIKLACLAHRLFVFSSYDDCPCKLKYGFKELSIVLTQWWFLYALLCAVPYLAWFD